jgi:hypothetical protein
LSSAAAANNAKKGEHHHHKSALMVAAHILVCLTTGGKNINDIANDFDNNFELVSVWIDYMVGINWMYKDGSDNKWIATDEGKKWIEKYYNNVIDD